MPSNEPKRIWRISRRLKEARAAANPKLSQSELARRLQSAGLRAMTPALASRLELGYAYATWPEVEAFAQVLNVQPSWLAESTEAPKAEEPQPAAQKKSAPIAPKPTEPEVAAPREVTSAVAPVPPKSPPAPVEFAPRGMANALSASGASTPPIPAAPAAPVVLEPLAIPGRGDRNAVDYRALLVAERSKAEQTMSQRGIPPAEWRRWRDYARDVNEALRSLRD